jgi:HEAT repeat protein
MIDLSRCISALSSADESERIYAAEDIGYANQSAGVEALLARLQVESSRAVKEAIFASLSQIEDQSVIEAMVNSLDSGDAFVRNQAVEVLRGRGTRVLENLDRAFAEGDSDRRKLVIDVLGTIGTVESVPIFERALRDADINVVITAVDCAGETRKTELRNSVEKLVSPEAHPMLLCACFEALAKIGDSTSLGVVRAQFESSTSIPGYLLGSYLKLLGNLGGPEDVGEIVQLIELVPDNEGGISALGALRSRHAAIEWPAEIAPCLERMVTAARSPLIAYNALRLMSALPHSQPVFEFIRRKLDSPEGAVRAGALQTLRESSAPEAVSAVKQYLAAARDEAFEALGPTGH